MLLPVLVEPMIPLSLFHQVLRAISYPIHDFTSLVTPEALVSFHFQLRVIKDLVPESSSDAPVDPAEDNAPEGLGKVPADPIDEGTIGL